MEQLDEKQIREREGESTSEELPFSEEREVIEGAWEENKIIREQLEKEVIKMRGRTDLEDEAKDEALKIKALKTEERLKRLLGIAQAKGMVMAIRICKEMEDPYLLDIFHDTLASNGYYKSLSR